MRSLDTRQTAGAFGASSRATAACSRSLAKLRAQLEPTGSEATEPRKTKKKETRAAPSLKALIDAGHLRARAPLIATFHAKQHQALVEADGHIRLADGSVYANPSRAAVAIAGHETNGWRFWKVLDDNKLVRLADPRAKLQASP